jgi:hypothetical protein
VALWLYKQSGASPSRSHGSTVGTSTGKSIELAPSDLTKLRSDAHSQRAGSVLITLSPAFGVVADFELRVRSWPNAIEVDAYQTENGWLVDWTGSALMTLYEGESVRWRFLIERSSEPTASLELEEPHLSQVEIEHVGDVARAKDSVVSAVVMGSGGARFPTPAVLDSTVVMLRAINGVEVRGDPIKDDDVANACAAAVRADARIVVQAEVGAQGKLTLSLVDGSPYHLLLAGVAIDSSGWSGLSVPRLVSCASQPLAPELDPLGRLYYATALKGDPAVSEDPTIELKWHSGGLVWGRSAFVGSQSTHRLQALAYGARETGVRKLIGVADVGKMQVPVGGLFMFGELGAGEYSVAALGPQSGHGRYSLLLGFVQLAVDEHVYATIPSHGAAGATAIEVACVTTLGESIAVEDEFIAHLALNVFSAPTPAVDEAWAVSEGFALSSGACVVEGLPLGLYVARVEMGEHFRESVTVDGRTYRLVNSEGTSFHAGIDERIEVCLVFEEK